MPKTFLCNGIQNCIDGSDEIEFCKNSTMFSILTPAVFVVSFYNFFNSYYNANETPFAEFPFRQHEVLSNSILGLSQVMFGYKCFSKTYLHSGETKLIPASFDEKWVLISAKLMESVKLVV